MQQLAELLLAKTPESFDERRVEAVADLQSATPGDGWEIRIEANGYSPSNYDNIWKNEARKSLVAALEAAGRDQSSYVAWLGGIHFTRAVIAPQALFPDGYRDNQGWRISVLGIPAASVAAVGIASHYQNAQNHNHLRSASNTFFDHITSLAAPREISVPGRKVHPDDWDRDGLFAAPHTLVDGVDVAGLDASHPGLWLKDVRTTTLKKVLASYITLVPLDGPAALAAQLSEAVTQTVNVATMLMGGTE